MPKNPKTKSQFTDEEAKEIFRRAMQSKVGQGLDREDLLEAAEELGIDADAVSAAADELNKERAITVRADVLRSRAKARFKNKFISWAAINTGLFAIDAFTGPGWWFQFPAVIWGVFVGLEGSKAWFSDFDEAAEKDLKREEIRRLRAEMRERERAAREAKKKNKQGFEKKFETAVERGVASLLSAAARGIDDFAQQSRDEGEFADYVKRSKQGKRTETRTTAGGKKIRVETEEPDFEEELVESATTKRKQAR